MREKKPRLAPEDHAAWDAVSRTVKPLGRRPRAAPLGPPAPQTARPRKPVLEHEPLSANRPAPQPLDIPAIRARSGLPAIEARLLRSIRRGQTPIDMRLDLHGQTQAQSHRLLERMLGAGRARGARVVLVVTGTGMRRGLDPDAGGAHGEGPGVLRRALPHWLALPPLSGWVMGVSQAAQHHGGAGAFYILLKRQRTVYTNRN